MRLELEFESLDEATIYLAALKESDMDNPIIPKLEKAIDNYTDCSMDCRQFRQWIYDHYNVPADNCTLAPNMLDAILEWAGHLEREQQQSFLRQMLPDIETSVIKRVYY